jgi:density-regulated protein
VADMPIEVVYCKICGIPPEYCMFDKKDSSECKEWLKNTHPELFAEVYPEDVKPAGEVGDEEIKEGAEGAQ